MRTIFLIIGIGVIGLLSLFGLRGQHVPVEHNTAQETNYWKVRAQSIGAAKAYHEFEQVYASTPPAAHSLAHLFGHLIYQELGDAGIAVCDASFGYGCFHQFTTDAALHGGEGEIVKLAEFCFEKSSSERDACFHGLGHGISEYFGPSHLMDAITQCAAFRVNEGSCDSGVFMDFNVPLVSADAGLDLSPRPFDPAQPNEPCTKVSAAADSVALHACYGSLAQWWMLASPGITVRHIGELCEAAPTSYRIDCYKGIGINLPGLELYRQDDVLAQCETIQSDDGKRACESSSASVLVGFGKPIDVLCRVLGDSCPRGARP